MSSVEFIFDFIFTYKYFLNRIINPIRFSLNRQLQQLSVAYKTPTTSLSVGQELHGYIIKEVNKNNKINDHNYSI
jgi:hypothetical protein